MISTSITFEIPMYCWQTSNCPSVSAPAGFLPLETQKLCVELENMELMATFLEKDESMIDLDSAIAAGLRTSQSPTLAMEPGIIAYNAYRCQVEHCTFWDTHRNDGGQGYGRTILHLFWMAGGK